MEASKELEWPKIDNPDDLLEAIKNPIEKFKKNKTLYHYTTLESLASIFYTKTLRFSSLLKTNDKVEIEWAGANARNKYLFCLANKRDSIGMWAMYGGLRNNDNCKYVKIGFPVKKLKDLLDGKNFVSSRNIIYADLMPNKDKEALYAKIKESQKKIEICSEKFAGYVKDKAWSYEKEIRLVIDKEEITGCSDCREEDGYIYLEVSENFLKSLVIVSSPIVDFEKCKEDFVSKFPDNRSFAESVKIKQHPFFDYLKLGEKQAEEMSCNPGQSERYALR